MATSTYTRSVAPASVRRIPRAATRLGSVLITGDVVAATLSWVAASSLPHSLLAETFARLDVERAAVSGGLLVIAVAVTIVTLAAERLYLSRVASMRNVEIALLARASLFVGGIALVAGRLLGENKPVRFPVLVAVLLFLFLNSWRMSFRSWLQKSRSAGRFIRPIILIGANDDAISLSQLVRSHPELGYRIVGIVGDSFRPGQRDFAGVPILGGLSSLERILQEQDINGAFVAGGAFTQDTMNRTVRLLLIYDKHIQLSTGIKGVDHRRLRSQSIAFEPMLYVEQADLDYWQLAVKRLMDVTITALAIFIASPLLLIAAILVRLHDGGPILFKQERVGRNGEVFTILKFRSMALDAENRLLDLRHDNIRQGPLFKLHSDPRVTPIGRIIRATSIDELPQLFNVLKGEMSLVGPRPALPSEAQHFDEELLARQHVLPGITGLWQVNGRDNPDFGVYQRMDLFYVENWSVALDVSILVGTVKVVAMRAVRTLTTHR